MWALASLYIRLHDVYKLIISVVYNCLLIKRESICNFITNYIGATTELHMFRTMQ